MSKTSSRSSSWLPDFLLLCVVLIWGANFPILKGALSDMHPHVANVFRFSFSAAVLGAYYSYRCLGTPEGFFSPLRTHWRRIVPLGLLGFAAHQIFFIIGINNTAAGNAALIMATNPVWTAVLSYVAGQETLGGRAWIGFSLTMAGTALVVVAGSSEVAIGTGSLFGNLMMLIAALLWGGYTAYNKPLVDKLSPTAVTFFEILAALPVLLAIGALYQPTLNWTQVDGWAWSALLFSGVLAAGIAFIFWNWTVRSIGASRTAVYYNLVPFVALLGGALLLGEPITRPQIAGGALIIGGLLLVRHARRHPVPA